MWELLRVPDQKPVKFNSILKVLEGIFLQEEGSKSGSERQKPGMFFQTLQLYSFLSTHSDLLLYLHY